MATTDLMVGIGAEYKGKAAFNKANKDIFGLTKAVKSLAAGYVRVDEDAPVEDETRQLAMTPPEYARRPGRPRKEHVRN